MMSGECIRGRNVLQLGDATGWLVSVCTCMYKSEWQLRLQLLEFTPWLLDTALWRVLYNEHGCLNGAGAPLVR
jgi:hypothetical protein